MSRLDKGLGLRLGLSILLIVICAIEVDGFATMATLASIVENVALIGLLAAGLMLTMVAGQLDAAVASVAAVSAIIALLLGPYSLVLGIVVALVVAGLYGCGIGWIIARTGVSSLVLTVCMLIGLRGLALILVPQSPAVLADGLLWVSDGLVARVGPTTVLGIIGLVLILALGLGMRCTRLGLSLYAVGGNLERARGSGVNTTKVYMVAFAGSAMLAATAGILAALRSGSASGTGLDSFLLDGVTAAVVGGVSLEGGRGSIINVLLGSLIVRIIAAAAALLGMQSSVESIATGCILLAMLLLDDALGTRRGMKTAARWRVLGRPLRT
ncbi:ABC transporter permease [Acidisoma cellulosilytica]|uniref:ABC transporter permease n=1 Tax=Acidisoma cellulosilyticum TaxID=2802395 RepID=A0A963Z561_9PROT|nr:ABC transporter permease [Acidisoma cellulosilyticum]MCB8882057.1 ABC transporter permease [Acidisoma cellulosilyticum]